MSGFEIVGLALGAVSLLIGALQHSREDQLSLSPDRSVWCTLSTVHPGFVRVYEKRASQPEVRLKLVWTKSIEAQRPRIQGGKTTIRGNHSLRSHNEGPRASVIQNPIRNVKVFPVRTSEAIRVFFVDLLPLLADERETSTTTPSRLSKTLGTLGLSSDDFQIPPELFLRPFDEPATEMRFSGPSGPHWNLITQYELLRPQSVNVTLRDFKKLDGSHRLQELLAKIDTVFYCCSDNKNNVLVLLANKIAVHQSYLMSKDANPNSKLRYKPGQNVDHVNFELQDSKERPLLQHRLPLIEELKFWLETTERAHGRRLIWLTESITASTLPIKISQDNNKLGSVMSLVVLRSYQTLLGRSYETLRLVDRNYARPRDYLMDPGSLALRDTTLKAIMTDAYLYTSIKEQVLNVTASMDAKLECYLATQDETLLPGLRGYASNLRSLGLDTKRCIQTLQERLDHHLKYLEHARNVRETQSLKKLSQLASVFLPLTLATGILSIQNRLVDLGSKFYDLCTITVFLGNLVFLFFAFVKFASSSKATISGLEHGRLDQKLLYRWRIHIFWVFAIIFGSAWIMIVTSFTIGSFKNVGLGLRILGFGMAATAGVSLVFGGCVFLIAKARWRLAKKLTRELAH